VAIALGLFFAAVLTGVTIPVDEPGRLLPVPEEALYSALAAVGYVFLFNVPASMAWACVMCGAASLAMRTLCLHGGMDLTSGTLVGATTAGLLAQEFARRFDAPAVAFAFPGVVAMIPGAFAFRAVIGCLRIGALGPAAEVALVVETMALAINCVLLVGAV